MIDLEKVSPDSLAPFARTANSIWLCALSQIGAPVVFVMGGEAMMAVT